MTFADATGEGGSKLGRREATSDGGTGYRAGVAGKDRGTETRRQAARKGMPDDKEPVGRQRETDGGW